MTEAKKPKGSRTLLIPVKVYLTPALAAALDKVRGEKSRQSEIRDRLARSLKVERPKVSMGRRKSKSKNPLDGAPKSG